MYCQARAALRCEGRKLRAGAQVNFAIKNDEFCVENDESLFKMMNTGAQRLGGVRHDLRCGRCVPGVGKGAHRLPVAAVRPSIYAKVCNLTGSHGMFTLTDVVDREQEPGGARLRPG